MKSTATTAQADKSLPPGWFWTTIGDILKVRNGYAFKSTDYTDDGVLLIRQSSLGGTRASLENAVYLPKTYINEYGEYTVRKGDILIGMSGSIGKLCIYNNDKPALQNQRTGLLVFKDDELKPWVWNYLPLVDNKLKEGGKGVGVQNISASQIEALPIPIAPKDQRRTIVAEIEKQFSRLDEAVANLKRVKSNLKRYKAAVLKAAVEGNLTEDWRHTHPNSETSEELLKRILAERRTLWEEKKPGKYTEPVSPDILNLTELPKGWVWTTLSTLLVDIEAGKSFKCDERPPIKDEVGVVKVSAVTWGEFDETESKTCLDSKLIKESLLIRAGDFLFSRANTIELVGACVVAKKVTSNLMLSDKILRFRLLRGLDQWVLYNLRSKFGRQEIERLATGNQESMRNIGQDRIRAIRIPLPPIEESRQIVAEIERRFSIVDEMEAQVGSDLKRAERLRQAVLMKAFAGQPLNHDNAESIEMLNVSAPSCA